MAMAPPASRRSHSPRVRVVIPMLGGLVVAAALALLLALGAAASSSSSLGGSSRPAPTAAVRISAATFRSVPHEPTPSADARPMLAPNAAALVPSSSLLVRRQVAAFVAAPAWRHLLAYPDDDDDDGEPRDPPPHGAGDEAAAASRADAERRATRASGEGAAETFDTSTVDVDVDPPQLTPTNIDAPSASLVRRRQVTAFVAAPARRRHLLAYLDDDDDDERPDPHGGAGGAAEAGADATFGTSVANPTQPTPPPNMDMDAPSASPGIAPPPPEAPLPPPPARCTFVTYVGGGAGTVEFAHDGDERVFVVREHTGSSNISHADLAAPLVLSSDEVDESDCDGYGDSDFSTAMEWLCRVLGHAVTAIDRAPWVLRLWEFFFSR